jgi:hypothetical protein
MRRQTQTEMIFIDLIILQHTRIKTLKKELSAYKINLIIIVKKPNGLG